MKLTDWSILFAMVFLCFVVPLDLRTEYLLRAFCLQQQDERVLDRICEDSLIDQILQENEDGTILVDEPSVDKRFEELLARNFDAVSAGQREHLQKSLRMKQFYYLGGRLDIAQTDKLRSRMEELIQKDSRSKRIRADERQLALFFPYIPREDWYQNLAGPSLYSLFEEDSSDDPWQRYRRYVFSGGRIVKRQPEAGCATVQCGSY